ncbi:MAG: hypothetical protein J6N21_17625 [Butyrivibrio sp.]|nr:hypothetical protein [Butyrivibrio sp.]
MITVFDKEKNILSDKELLKVTAGASTNIKNPGNGEIFKAAERKYAKK